VILIETRHLFYTWPGADRSAIDGLDLRIGAGEYVAIVGRNGSGKSTLLRLFDGLILPSSGEVAVDGHKTDDPASIWEIRAACALVFQSPRDQLAASVVEEDAAFGPLNLGVSRQEAVARAGEALGAVGLLEERRRPVHALSAGQQQRLAIAGALAMNPRCIAFDEATSMLDPPSRTAVLDLMDGLVGRGIAVVHVTHDMEEACRASRIVVLARGKAVFDGSPAALFGLEDPESPPPALALGLALPPNLTLTRALGLEGNLHEGIEKLAGRIASTGGTGKRNAPSAVSPPHAEAREVMTPFVFGLEAASYSYLHGTEAEVVALEDLDMVLDRGKSLALVGKTGSGKSTLLQLLDALARPTRGRAVSFGIDTAARDADLGALRIRAPLSVQRPETALFETFAGDDVAFGPRNLGLKGGDLVKRVSAWMEAVGLPFKLFRDRQVRSLSGGEKRRLALAGVFAMESEAILLDEPTASLDPETAAAVRALISGAGKRGATLVIATHSMEEAAKADLMAVVSHGRMLAFGPPVELFYESFDPAWEIGRPRAVEIAIALGRLGVALADRPLDMPSLIGALGRGGQALEGRVAS